MRGLLSQLQMNGRAGWAVVDIYYRYNTSMVANSHCDGNLITQQLWHFTFLSFLFVKDLFYQAYVISYLMKNICIANAECLIILLCLLCCLFSASSNYFIHYVAIRSTKQSYLFKATRDLNHQQFNEESIVRSSQEII